MLYHHGVAQQRNLLTLQTREWLAGLALGAAAREQITIALSVIDALDLGPFDQDLRALARKQPGCRALTDQVYGVRELTAVPILAELGDTRRFHNSRDVVRCAGLDITVYQSDNHRAPKHLSRQGAPAQVQRVGRDPTPAPSTRQRRSPGMRASGGLVPTTAPYYHIATGAGASVVEPESVELERDQPRRRA